MVDFNEERILGGYRPVPNGMGTCVGFGTQDCAALVLGYFRFSLREKERGDEVRESMTIGRTAGVNGDRTNSRSQ